MVSKAQEAKGKTEILRRWILVRLPLREEALTPTKFFLSLSEEDMTVLAERGSPVHVLTSHLNAMKKEGKVGSRVVKLGYRIVGNQTYDVVENRYFRTPYLREIK